MAAQYQFVMRSGPSVGKVFTLEASEITIGRESTNGIAINDVEVSRRHARMELRGSSYVIQDLGSTNGTFVNGQRVLGMQVLNPGDSVSLGEGIVLTFESIYDPNATVMSAKAVPPPPPASAATAIAAAPVIPPPPVSSYSGQVPSGPVPAVSAPVKKKKFPVWLIIVLILLLIILCCGAVFFIIDQFNLWCRLVPFLVPLLGGTCS